MTGMAFVVLVAGDRTSSMFLDGGTCLNQVARLARLFGPKIKIAMTYELTEAKWEGRGQQ